MILNKLVLSNVGTFAGRQELELTPPSRDQPIVLIGGLNGAGKTTVLESIQLALYGSLVHTSGRRNGSYENYLRGLVHRGASVDDGSCIELTFQAHQEGEERTYWLRRSWRRAGAGIREILLVKVNGQHDQTLQSTWSEYVETFLPRGIAGLFFFDGEQIEALADMERSKEVLESALAALLGIDLVDRLSADLAVLRRRHKGRQVPDVLRHDVEQRRLAVTAHGQAEEAATLAEASRQNEVERAQKRHFQAIEAFRAAGGELSEKREQAEADATRYKADLRHCEESIRRELEGSAPLLQLSSLVGSLQDQLRRELGARRDALLVDAISERDELLLDKLKSSDISAATIEDVAGMLSGDRARRLATANVPQVTGLINSEELDIVVKATLPEARRRLAELIALRADLRHKVDQNDRMLAAIPDPEALAVVRAQRDDARDAVLRAEAALGTTTEMLVRARSDRQKAQDQYEAALDRSAEATLSADDDRRLLDHVERVRATLQELRVAATRRHVDRIAHLVFEALGMLLRKQDLIAEVQIDPETFGVALTGADGYPLPASHLSAGERQLLAVALLWGLARASGQPLPVVIDTPLGRLDRTHRNHLLERYFPHASHQVILLSTDTEIDADALALLRPHVGRHYSLRYDSARRATSVVPGYFWE